MKKHRGKLSRIMGNNRPEDLLQNIRELTSIYSCDFPILITLEEKPIFVRTKSPQIQPHNQFCAKILNALLLPEGNQSGQITSAWVHKCVKKHPELYAENPKEVSVVLSLLEI